MKKIWKYLKPFRLRIVFGMIIKIIGTLMDLAIPWLLAYIINEVKEPAMMIKMGLLMILCAFIGLFGNIIANAMASMVGRKFTTALRHDVYKKINDLSLSQVDELTIPSLISRMTNDTYNVHQMITSMQRIGTRAPILLLGGIIVTLTLDSTLTLVLLASLPIIALVIFLITKKGIPIYTNVQLKTDKMVQTVRENITGMKVIKALSKEDYEKTRFEKVNKALFDEEKRAGINMAKSNPLINLILNIGLVIVIIIGAYRVYDGLIKVGIIIAFTSYFTIILNAMVTMGRLFIIYSRAIASGKRISVVLDLENDLERIEDISNSIKSPYFIEFNDVSFNYNANKNKNDVINSKENKALALSNINFKLKKTDRLGIIGATGAGKSTVIRLLLRFYDCTSGEILINGKDIRSLDIKAYRNDIGVVLQNDAIMSDTVISNIAFGKEIDLDKIKECAKLSNAYDFIMKMDKGFDSIITARGTNLSGGQKQRLLIARAIYANPKILILDDSSSALDYQTEAMIKDNINNKINDCVQIIISSRVSSVINCDYILVIDDGMEVGFGNHFDLINNCSIYQDIYRLQTGGDKDE